MCCSGAQVLSEGAERRCVCLCMCVCAYMCVHDTRSLSVQNVLDIDLDKNIDLIPTAVVNHSLERTGVP